VYSGRRARPSRPARTTQSPTKAGSSRHLGRMLPDAQTEVIAARRLTPAIDRIVQALPCSSRRPPRAPPQRWTLQPRTARRSPAEHAQLYRDGRRGREPSRGPRGREQCPQHDCQGRRRVGDDVGPVGCAVADPQLDAVHAVVGGVVESAARFGQPRGDEPAFATVLVPPGVPSLVHSSVPCVPSSAVK
jgi:hypothetical protein